MKVYLDNAATTRLDEEVFDAMLPFLKETFGNPSSIHSHGREARAAIEKARRILAARLNASPAEIFFTSGGTEADNMAIVSSIQTYGLKHAITSPIEHHAVLHSLQHMERMGFIRLSYVNLTKDGSISMEHMEELLQNNPRSLVSLMHANNEIGNITDIENIGLICKASGALFHSDTVQTVSHIPIDLQAINVHYINGSAHKFHGPKGAGFIYINSEAPLKPFIQGGAQERNMRGGTENVAAIVGMAKAFELAYDRMGNDRLHIESLKKALMEKLKERIKGVEFNGVSAEMDNSLYTILSASIPESDDNEMLLFNLDIQGISVSGGSACTSGSVIGSHVLQTLNVNPARGHVRFSFSRYNTMGEIQYVVDRLAEFADHS